MDTPRRPVCLPVNTLSLGLERWQLRAYSALGEGPRWVPSTQVRWLPLPVALGIWHCLWASIGTAFMCTNPHTYVHIVKPINIKSLITLMKYYDQKQLGEERVWLTFWITVHWGEPRQGLKPSETGIWRQELIQRPKIAATYWLVSHGLFRFFIKSGAISPDMAPSKTGWALPHQSLVKKMLWSLA